MQVRDDVRSGAPRAGRAATGTEIRRGVPVRPDEHSAEGIVVKVLPHPLEEGEFRLNIRREEFGSYGQKVLEEVAQWVEREVDWSTETPNHEGIRVNCSAEEEQGWFLLRMSLHDPVMPLNIESDVRGGVKSIAMRLHRFLGRFEYLGLEALENA